MCSLVLNNSDFYEKGMFVISILEKHIVGLNTLAQVAVLSMSKQV